MNAYQEFKIIRFAPDPARRASTRSPAARAMARTSTCRVSYMGMWSEARMPMQ
jgi:hypothetical protein